MRKIIFAMTAIALATGFGVATAQALPAPKTPAVESGTHVAVPLLQQARWWNRGYHRRHWRGPRWGYRRW